MSVNNHRKCAKCGKTRDQDMTVSYHRFPNPGTTNITKARVWAKYCWPNEDCTSIELLRSLHNQNKVLCGRHFNSTQFIDNKRQKLGKFAVPDSIIVEELLKERENIFHQMNSQKESTRTCCMCGASPCKDPSITLHRFPKPGSKNALRCELWAKYCFPNEAWSSPKFQEELYSKHKMLCSKHFESTCFIEKTMFKTAVPGAMHSEADHPKQLAENSEKSDSPVAKSSEESCQVISINDNPTANPLEINDSQQMDMIDESQRSRTPLPSNSKEMHSDKISPTTKECKVSLQRLPQTITDCNKNEKHATSEQNIATVEAINKIYKVVSINNKLMLVEQNENDLDLDSIADNSSIDEDYDPNKDKNNSDSNSDGHPEEEITKNMHQNQIKSNTCDVKTYRKPCNNNDKSKSELISKKPFPIFYKSKNPFASNSQNVLNNVSYKNLYPGVYVAQNQNDNSMENLNKTDILKSHTKDNKIRHQSPEFTRVVEDFVDHFADIMNCEWYNDQDILIYGKHGTAMVLLHEAKYNAMKKSINEKDFIEAAFKKCKEEQKVLQMEFDAVQAELNKVQEQLKRVEEQLNVVNIEQYLPLKSLHNKLKPELMMLRAMKENLHKIYSEAQISIMTNQKKYKLQWPDDDIKKIIFLKTTVSPKTYRFLRNQMNFPLPSPDVVEKWMTERNMYARTKRKGKKSKDAKMQDVEMGVDIQNPSRKEEVETQEAVQMIIEQPQAEVVINVANDQDATGPVYTDGQLCLSYMDDSNINEEYYVVEDNGVNNNNDNSNVHYVVGEIYAQDSAYQSHNVNENNTNLDSEIQNNDENYAEYISEDNLHYIDAENQTEQENNALDNDNLITNENYNPDGNVQSSGKYSKWDLNKLQKYSQLRHGTWNNWKLTCQLCMRPFETEEEVKQHVRVHYYNTFYTTYIDAEKPYVCEFCHEKLPHRFALIRHHIIHLAITEFKCWHPGCTYIGKNKACLASHIDRHLPRRHTCPKCHAAFKLRISLRDHFARRHSARGIYRCQLCKGICLSEYTFHRHMVSHNKPPRYKCTEEGCTESFYSRRALGTHKLSHSGGTLYQCPHCPIATFNNSYHLKKHLERHETDQITQCCKCDKIFDTFKEYYYHIKTDPHKSKRMMHTCACKESFKSKRKFQSHQKECKFVVNDNKKRRKRIVYKHNLNYMMKKTQVPLKQIPSDILIDEDIVAEYNVNSNDSKTVEELSTDQMTPMTQVKSYGKSVPEQKVITLSQENYQKTYASNLQKGIIATTTSLEQTAPELNTDGTTDEQKKINAAILKLEQEVKSRQTIKLYPVNEEQTHASDLQKGIATTANLNQIDPELNSDCTSDEQKKVKAAILKLEQEIKSSRRKILMPQQKSVQEKTIKLYPVNEEQKRMIEKMTRLKKLIPVSHGNTLKKLRTFEKVTNQKTIEIHQESNQQKDAVSNLKTLVQIIPQIDEHNSDKLIPEEKVIAVSEESCQISIASTSEKANQNKIIAPMIKLEQERHEENKKDIPEENVSEKRPKVITLSKKNILRKLSVTEFNKIMAASPLNFTQNIKLLPKDDQNIIIDKSNQTISTVDDNLRHTALVVETPEYSQHFDSWQDQNQEENEILIPDTSTQQDMPSID